MVNKIKLPFWVCHQKPERCFKFKNKPMPLCSRCFGLYLFLLFGFFIPLLFKPKLSYSQLLIITIVFSLPLFFDVITQLAKIRESNNLLRFATGSLAGIICGIDIYYLIIP